MTSSLEWIEVYVADLKQMFNLMDPSPFHEKDLDPAAEEFIVGWAGEIPANARLGLRVYTDRPAARDEEPLLRGAVDEFFRRKGAATRQRLRRLLRLGRTSLVIGVVVLTTSVGASELVTRALAGSRLGAIIGESLLIGGWVAMWRPLEIFLYEWWPIRADARLYDRLSEMPVQVVVRST